MAPTAKAARQEGKRDVEYEFRLRVEWNRVTAAADRFRPAAGAAQRGDAAAAAEALGFELRAPPGADEREPNR